MTAAGAAAVAAGLEADLVAAEIVAASTVSVALEADLVAVQMVIVAALATQAPS